MNSDSVLSSNAVQSEQVPITIAGAGFGIRLAAQIIDIVIHHVVWVTCGILVGVAIAFYSEANHVSFDMLANKLSARKWYDFVAAGLGVTLYHAVMEGMSGATVGK